MHEIVLFVPFRRSVPYFIPTLALREVVKCESAKVTKYKMRKIHAKYFAF